MVVFYKVDLFLCRILTVAFSGFQNRQSTDVFIDSGAFLLSSLWSCIDNYLKINIEMYNYIPTICYSCINQDCLPSNLLTIGFVLYAVFFLSQL